MRRLAAATAFLAPPSAFAQCALCRAALRSSGQKGLIRGLSLSILFILAVSILVLGGIAYLVYKASRHDARR